jgi:hypothetical protein
MKNSNKSVVLIGLFIVCVLFAVGGYFWYKKKDDKDDDDQNDDDQNDDNQDDDNQDDDDQNDDNNEIVLEIQSDGSLGETDGTRENFVYVAKNDHPDTKPPFYQYYTNTTTRKPIWDGLSSVPESFPPCENPDCKYVEPSNKEEMQLMLDDVIQVFRRDILDFRNFLKSVGLARPSKFMAKYKEYDPAGITGLDTALNYSFIFEEMIKGYAAYKQVPVLSESNYSDYEDFYAQLPILKQIGFIINIMFNKIRIVMNDGKRYLKIKVDKNRSVRIKPGFNYPYFMFIVLVSFIKMIRERKNIRRIIYNPPSNILSEQEMMDNIEI